MTQTSYTYVRALNDRYVFTSEGKRPIQKIVKFEHTSRENIINMAFGDLREDGSIDDMISSNNGDMIQILAAVIGIVKDYTKHHPHKEIYFAGSASERTRLYTRILRTYCNEFSKDFHISAMIPYNNTVKRISFDPTLKTEYLAFLIKRFN